MRVRPFDVFNYQHEDNRIFIEANIIEILHK